MSSAAPADAEQWQTASYADPPPTGRVCVCEFQCHDTSERRVCGPSRQQTHSPPVLVAVTQVTATVTLASAGLLCFGTWDMTEGGISKQPYSVKCKTALRVRWCSSRSVLAEYACSVSHVMYKNKIKFFWEIKFFLGIFLLVTYVYIHVYTSLPSQELQLVMVQFVL